MKNLKFLKPITLTLESDEDGSIIISDDTFQNYGVGNTPAEAMAAYVEDLTIYYEILKERISDEYPENEKHLNFIKQYVVLID